MCSFREHATFAPSKPIKQNSDMTNKKILWAAMLLTLPLVGWGQSGMYSMSQKKKSTTTVTAPASVQASSPVDDVEIIYVDDDELPVTTGPVRDVDEYNRRGTAAYSYAADSLIEQPSLQQEPLSSNQTASAYEQGYREGYIDGEDYAIARRLGRFSYASIYSSPWYWGCYGDPYYYDWYWDDPYWYRSYYGYGYYGWHRPYWGYYSPYWYGSYYDPYWYGYGRYGYYGHHPHDGYHNWGRPGNSPRGTFSGRRPGQTGRSAGYGSGYSGGRTNIGGRNTGLQGGRVSGSASSRSGRIGSSRASGSASTRSGSTSGGSSRSGASSSRSGSTYSGSTSTRSSSTPSYSGSSRSSSGSFSGGSRSSGGGGGFTGGSRGGGGGRGR